MAGKVILLSLQLDTKEYVKNVMKAQKEVASLTAQQKAQKKTIKELQDQLIAEGKTTSNAYKAAQAALSQLDAKRKAALETQRNAQKAVDTAVKSNNAEIGSYERLYRRYIDAEKQLKLMPNAYKQNADGSIVLTKEYQKQAAEVVKLKEGLLEFNAGIKDGRLNVGNYKAAFTDAIKETGLFKGALGQIGSALTQTGDIALVARQGISQLSEGMGLLTEKAKTFSVSVGNAFSNAFTNNRADVAGEGLENVADGMDSVTESTDNAKKSFNIFTNSGVSGAKILRIALASIGIGLILIAIASLVSYFTKFQTGMDKIRVVSAQAGAVIDVITSSFAQLGKALATFDVTQIGKSFNDVGDKASAAAAKMKELELAKIALEKQDIKNIAIQGELQRQIGDLIVKGATKTLSDQERIDAIKEAGRLEVELMKIQQTRAAQELKIAEAEIQQRIDNGQALQEIDRTLLKSREELAEKSLNLLDDIGDKEKEVAAETSKLQKTLNKELIQANIAMLNNRLAEAELNGQKNYVLQRQIAAQERAASLEDTTLNAQQKLLIESDYQLKLKELRKQQADDERAIADSILDARFDSLVDSYTKEIAVEATQLQRKIDALTGTEEQIARQREALVEQSAMKVLDIELKYAQKSAEEKAKINEQNQSVLENAVNAGAEKELNQLRVSLSRKAITEQEFADESVRIEQDRLKRILDIQLQIAGTRIANDNNFYNEQDRLLKAKFDKGEIDLEAYNSKQAELNNQRYATELETEQANQATIGATTAAINQSKVDATVAANTAIIANEKETQALRQVVTQEAIGAASALIGGLGELLAQDEKNRKKYAAAMKAIGVAQILIDLQKEIAGYWLGVGKDTGTGGAAAGVLSATSATLRTIGASIRAGVSVAKVRAFAQGGFTFEDAIAKYNPEVAQKYLGGFTSRPVVWQSNGNLNLAGESGTEYVAPPHQVRQAPHIFSALERWRTTGVRPFADGGYTMSTISQPLINSAQLFEDAIAKGFAKAPPQVLSVQEVTNVQNRIATIESRSSLQ